MARRPTARERDLQAEIAGLIEQIDAVTRCQAVVPKAGAKPKRPRKGAPRKPLTAIMPWSDWHVEETTREVGGDGRILSIHGPEASRVKVGQIVDGALAVADRHSQRGYQLDHVTIALLGDFITGHLHEDNIEQCALPPTDAAMLAYELLADALTRYVKHTPARTVRVVTRPGNHGRTTDRMRSATATGHSWEQLVYKMLRANLADLRTSAGNRVEWVIEDGIMTYTQEPVVGLVRWIHGHEIKYSGGVNGLAVPVAKKIHRYNAEPGGHAALTVLGHFHQPEYQSGPPAFLVNGSLIGVSSYSRSLGFGSGTPVQAHLTYSEEHGQLFALDLIHADPAPET